MMTKSGMMISTLGNICEERKNFLRNFDPLKRKRLNAYAAVTERMTQSTVVERETIALFLNCVTKSVVLKTST